MLKFCTTENLTHNDRYGIFARQIKHFVAMRKYISVFVIALFAISAQAQVKKLNPFVSTTTFNLPGQTPYVENALAFECKSVTYKEFQPGKFKATLEIITAFKKGEETTFSKVLLDSPIVTDTSKLDGAFVNQQRFPLANGEYVMEIIITDKGSDRAPVNLSVTVDLDYPKDMPAVSDILLFDSYSKATTPSECTKSGYDFVPRVFPFYSTTSDKLKFYTELYNSDRLYDEGKYMVCYYIEAAESSSLMQDYYFTKRFDVAKATPLINSIDIENLPSGNYYLVVEMRDRSNTLICSNSVFFQRSNPGIGYKIRDISGVNIANTFVTSIDNIDTLRRYLRYLEPISSEAERDYAHSLVRTDDKMTMQQYLYNFWSTRSPLNPRDAFNDYLAAVRRVNASFSNTSTPGFRTDRGYVFLKYGQPDQIVDSPNEPGAYPYQIWHYYVVANQRNKRFVFMSKDDSTNDYQLIHSDVIGELNNYRWKLEVYSRIYGEHYDEGVDQTDYEEGWGKHAGDLYDNPR